MKTKSRNLAVNALLATLIVIFAFIPIMPIGVNLAALMLIPVIMAGQVEGWRSALFAGTFLGVLRFIIAFIMPSPTAPLFRNPLVSILPRMFIGIVVWLVYNLLNKVLSKRIKPALAHTISAAISAACGVITNTGLVCSMIAIFYFGKTVGSTAISGEFMMGLISINFVIEIVVAVLLCPPISYALRKTVSKSRYKVTEYVELPLEVINENDNNSDNNRESNISNEIENITVNNDTCKLDEIIDDNYLTEASDNLMSSEDKINK